MVAEKKCCVPTCNRPRSPGTSLHGFPNPEKDAERFRTWLYSIGGDMLAADNQYIYKYRNICQKHFESRYITRGNKLTNIAIPSLQMQGLQTKSAAVNKTPGNEETELAAGNAISSDVTRLEIDETPAISDAEHFDDDCMQSNEEPIPSSIEFSWQKSSTAVPCDTEVNKDLVMQCEEPEEIYMYDEPGPPSAALETGKDTATVVDDLERIQQEYQCNVCGGEISGFRYTCVQCADYDMCCACEAAGAHAAHYVLRVPGPRPYSEVQAVLARIRQVLVTDSVIHLQGVPYDELKVEVKEEDPDPIYVEQVAPPSTARVFQETQATASDPPEERNDSYEEVEKEDIEALDEDVESLHGDVETLDKDIESLHGDVETLDKDIESLHGDVETLDEEMSEEGVNTYFTQSPHSQRSDSPVDPLLDNHAQQNTRVAPRKSQGDSNEGLAVSKAAQNTNPDAAPTQTRKLSPTHPPIRRNFVRLSAEQIKTLKVINAKTNPVTAAEKIRRGLGRELSICLPRLSRQYIDRLVRRPSTSTMPPPIDTQHIGESERTPHTPNSSKTRDCLATQGKNQLSICLPTLSSQNMNLNFRLPSTSTMPPPIDTQHIGESEKTPHTPNISKTGEYVVVRCKNMHIRPQDIGIKFKPHIFKLNPQSLHRLSKTDPK